MKVLFIIVAMLTGVANSAYAQCGNQGVYIFSAYWCPACKATERFLTNYDISYERFEVTSNPRVQQFMREQFGTTEIPIVVVDGNYRLGFDPEWLREELCVR